MAYPEGYRKAMRAMALADRHGFPLVTLVDTPGAYPGVAAEQHGQGGAIARSQAAMVRLGVPTVAVRHRRGRLGRRGRDRRRRPRADAGERDLLGDLAGGLRGDPLARRGRGAQGRGGVQAGRRALPRARRDRRRSSPSRREARTRSATRPRRCSSRRILDALDEIEALDPDERRRERRAKYRVDGRARRPAALTTSFHRFHRLIPGSE